MANYFLGAAEVLLKRGQGAVQILKTLKANGENAQISYCPRLGAWLLCSKNVSLAARGPKDLELYSESRFRFA